METSSNSLIPFLLFLSNYSENCQLRRLNSNYSCLRSSLYSLGMAPTEKTASSIVTSWFTAAEICPLHRCVATSAALTTENTALLLLLAFASTGMCLPSRCLTMNYSGFQASCHTTLEKANWIKAVILFILFLQLLFNVQMALWVLHTVILLVSTFP
jgi:hypothetical protein